MNSFFKVRRESPPAGLIVAISLATIFLFTMVVFGENTGFRVLSVLVLAYAAFSLWVYLRTRNNGYLAAAAYQLCLSLVIVNVPSARAGLDSSTIRFWLGLMFVTGGIMIFMVVTKRTKWRGREILELAAAPVEDTDSGYTARPRPVGKVPYNESELRAFARFAARNLIALTHVEEDRLVFVPVMMGYEYMHLLGLKRDYAEETWVSFTFDGHVAVHISRGDYVSFREELSFDELCLSLGELFIGFLDRYAAGEGDRIVCQMNDVGVEIFS